MPNQTVRAADALPSLPRIVDVARHAGVSTATVDRVVNRRDGVRLQTVQRVLAAAAELGFALGPEFDAQRPARHDAMLHGAQPDMRALTLRAGRPLELLFLLPAGENPYLRMLGDYVELSHQQWAPFQVRCRTHYVESFNPAELARRLLQCGARADGIAFMALEHPVVRDAVDALAERGVPAVTLISDVSNSRRLAYVGIDNRAAGRTAGLLLGRFMGPRPSGKVAMLAGSLDYRSHEEREIGFLHLMESTFPGIRVIGMREGQDDSQRNYEQTRHLFEQHPDLAGIYNSGGASDGVARAINETRREHKPLFIGHGLTPDTRALLIDGTLDALITQTPQAIVGTCVRVFRNARDGAADPVKPIPFNIVLRENLP
ncbi:LacI family DNA-binding transcriptional regulator [Chitinasiproducens palmae]|uniref:Transcriptional regulator, LacI family n=1 Tax=Chitinasiproducens palmae TaxID=1770053 RepID=A0A1H2PV99_9BURK|nr:LacI family DNA-binding transcriptional regulator [Chitinasiproducens palmae]SDV50358.1 transcriptional regulator, LacI family [Chitinasiproducens palmae]